MDLARRLAECEMKMALMESRLTGERDSVLALCVRRRPCSEVPDAIRWAVTLPGSWGEGFPTREAAESAILKRASEVTT